MAGSPTSAAVADLGVYGAPARPRRNPKLAPRCDNCRRWLEGAYLPDGRLPPPLPEDEVVFCSKDCGWSYILRRDDQRQQRLALAHQQQAHQQPQLHHHHQQQDHLKPQMQQQQPQQPQQQLAPDAHSRNCDSDPQKQQHQQQHQQHPHQNPNPTPAPTPAQRPHFLTKGYTLDSFEFHRFSPQASRTIVTLAPLDRTTL